MCNPPDPRDTGPRDVDVDAPAEDANDAVKSDGEADAHDLTFDTE